VCRTGSDCLFKVLAHPCRDHRCARIVAAKAISDANKLRKRTTRISTEGCNGHHSPQIEVL
jgi:hypothetical protein